MSKKEILIKATEEQQATLIGLVNNSQFIGSSAEAVVELKKVLKGEVKQ